MNPMIEKTLVLIKPDAVKRGIIGEIVSRFERASLKVVAAKLIDVDEDLAKNHYPDSIEWKTKVGQRTLDDCKKYNIDVIANMGTDDPVKLGEIVKKWNMDFLMSGPVLAFVFEGVNAVERVRSLVGDTNPVKAAPGTIRGDYSIDSPIVANRRTRTIYNLIHASGSVDEASAEIELWFENNEILSYKRVHEELYKY